MTTTTNDQFTAGDEHRSSAEIENDIRRTRDRMDATLDELGNRLTARSLLNSALDWWEQRGARGAREVAGTKTKHAYDVVARQVKEHPGPSMLIGAGVAWLIMQANSDDDRAANDFGTEGVAPYPARSRAGVGVRYPEYRGAPETESNFDSGGTGEDGGAGLKDKANELAGRAKDAASGAADMLREKASGLGDAVHGAAGRMAERSHEFYDQGRAAGRRLGHQLESGYRSGADQFHDAVQEYPLGVGLGFSALGALIGLLVPGTRREDELMGERSDRLVETVKEAGRETLEQGKHLASRVAEAAAGAAEKQGLTAESATGALSGLADRAAEVLRSAKDEARAGIEELKNKEPQKQ